MTTLILVQTPLALASTSKFNHRLLRFTQIYFLLNYSHEEIKTPRITKKKQRFLLYVS